MRVPLPLFLFAALVLTTTTAIADVIPEDGGCDGRKEGDTCQAYRRDPSASSRASYLKGPGQCAPFGSDGKRGTSLNCFALAPRGIPGVTLANHDCEGKSEGQACSTINDRGGKGPGGACGPIVHGDMGKVLGCDTTRTPLAVPPPYTPPVAPSGRACSCGLAGAPAGHGGLAALAWLAATTARRRCRVRVQRR